MRGQIAKLSRRHDPAEAMHYVLKGRLGGVTMHVNEVDHVTTIDRVAAQLGESFDCRIRDLGTKNLRQNPHDSLPPLF